MGSAVHSSLSRDEVVRALADVLGGRHGQLLPAELAFLFLPVPSAGARRSRSEVFSTEGRVVERVCFVAISLSIVRCFRHSLPNIGAHEHAIGKFS